MSMKGSSMMKLFFGHNVPMPQHGVLPWLMSLSLSYSLQNGTAQFKDKPLKTSIRNNT